MFKRNGTPSLPILSLSASLLSFIDSFLIPVCLASDAERKIPWGVSSSNFDCIIQVLVVGQIRPEFRLFEVIFFFCFTSLPTPIYLFFNYLALTCFFRPYRSLKSSARVWRASEIISLTVPTVPPSVRRMVEMVSRRAPRKMQDPFSSWISLYRIYKSKINLHVDFSFMSLLIHMIRWSKRNKTLMGFFLKFLIWQVPRSRTDRGDVAHSPNGRLKLSRLFPSRFGTMAHCRPFKSEVLILI